MSTMVLFRSLQLVAVAVLVGAPLFLSLIWRPALVGVADPESLDRSVRRRILPLSVAAALTLSALALADLLRLSASLTMAPWLSGENLGVAVDLVSGSDLGRWSVLRAAMAVGLLACRPWRPPTKVSTAAMRAFSLALLASFSFTGHAVATKGYGLLPVLTDVVHMTATAAWYGGLFTFALLPWRALSKLPSVTACTVDRFSKLGLVAIAALAATGLYMATLRLYGLLALVEYDYGRTLLVKLSFLAGVLLLAAVNHFFVRPRLQGGAPLGGLLRGLVTAEAAVGLAVVLTAGMLSTTPPPQGEPVRLTVTLSDMQITPPILDIPRNKPVRLTVTNQASQDHSYVVRGIPHEMLSGGGEHDHGSTQDMRVLVSSGRSVAVTLVARRAGRYEVYCMIDDHLYHGMTGVLVVP